jgi:hypothetical protein
MDWLTRTVREYEDGRSLLVLPITREVRGIGISPFKEYEEQFAYAVLYRVPALPADWLSISLFGLYPETEKDRPWVSFPKVDLNIHPREWRTVGSKADGSHVFYGIVAPPDDRIPLADRWEAK